MPDERRGDRPDRVAPVSGRASPASEEQRLAVRRPGRAPLRRNGADAKQALLKFCEQYDNGIFNEADVQRLASLVRALDDSTLASWQTNEWVQFVKKRRVIPRQWIRDVRDTLGSS
jgi:hypothetical protein